MEYRMLGRVTLPAVLLYVVVWGTAVIAGYATGYAWKTVRAAETAERIERHARANAVPGR